MIVKDHMSALSAALQANAGAAATVESWGTTLASTFRRGGRLLTCGNGGSAAEAQHLTSELVGRFERERAPYSAIALHSDSSTTSAIMNDYGPDHVFARQVSAHGRRGDILLALSTSGSSTNVLAAADAARRLGLRVLSLTGPPPNPLSELSDSSICVVASKVATVQEVHLCLIHALCSALELASAIDNGS